MTHSIVLAWRIPGTEESGRLLSVGSHKSLTRLKQLSSSSHKDDGKEVGPYEERKLEITIMRGHL